MPPESDQGEGWVFEVRGDAGSLEDAATIYQAGADIKLGKFDDGPGRTFFGMRSPQFDSLVTARAVHELGLRLLAIVNGILFIRDPRRRALIPGGVRNKNANGTWNITLIAETAVFETRFFAPTVTSNGQEAAISPYANWTNDANSDDRVAEVLTYLSGEPDWFDLYNVYEIMRADTHKRFGKETPAGWPTKAQRNLFTESANVYRHSSEEWDRYNPDTAMPLRDGQEFIRNWVIVWLSGRQKRSGSA
jgi:hypothetical protein